MKVLFATDGSEAAGAAQQLLATLPFPAGTAIQILTITGELAWQAPEWVRYAEHERATVVLQRAAAGLAREGVDVASTVRSGAVASEILAAADEFGVDLLVVGSEGLSGVAGFLLGSVARNVAKHAHCPVLVGRAPRNGLRQVLLAVDESEHAQHAGAFLARLPLPAEAAITVTHVVRPYLTNVGFNPDYVYQVELAVAEANRQHHEAAAQVVDRFVGELAAAGRPASGLVRDGNPAAEILDLAGEREADLIVAGARGVSVLRGLIVGSVADRLLKTARCSLLIVH
jgi:nucleotide-binding universal stress UspA family protein